MRLKLTVLTASLILAGCATAADLPISAGTGPNPQLPPPQNSLFPTVNIAKAVGWPDGGQPTPAAGTSVKAFASGLDHPRWLHILPNGDVLVAETNAPDRPDDMPGIKGWFAGWIMDRAGAGVDSANRITLLRDTDGDGVADQRSAFLTGLNSPFGMALIGDSLYVANTDAVVRFPYQAGQTRITAKGETLAELPAGSINHHWTKNLIASPDGKTLYAAVGSNSNIAENGLDKEAGRAAIWAIDAATGEHHVYATGLRNPVGMAWQPETGALWVAVNERDELGDNLVPDYMTSVKEGGFYGWPFSYYGQHVDTRVEPQNPALVAQALVPDYALGSHTASLGLTNALGNRLPERFAHGMFIGQHGSWNREPRSGYKVIFVPFRNGQPSGAPETVLGGFVVDDEAQGRPVGVAIAGDGALLVADDVGNAIWRVSADAETAGR